MHIQQPKQHKVAFYIVATLTNFWSILPLFCFTFNSFKFLFAAWKSTNNEVNLWSKELYASTSNTIKFSIEPIKTMITSHAHQIIETNMTSATETFASEAPPGGESPAQFEDDFDIPPIHLPPSALGTVF